MMRYQEMTAGQKYRFKESVQSPNGLNGLRNEAEWILGDALLDGAQEREDSKQLELFSVLAPCGNFSPCECEQDNICAGCHKPGYGAGLHDGMCYACIAEMDECEQSEVPAPTGR